MSANSIIATTDTPQHFAQVPADFDSAFQLSIETGYFVFTMMPSLKCSLNCPHCYLSLEQRRDSTTMQVNHLAIACDKVVKYYDMRPDLKHKVIIFYWYGGEPTEMGIPYMLDCFRMIQDKFPPEKGFFIRHDILTSLLNVEDAWFDIFKHWGQNHFQTSFDGLMRGKGYVKKWERRLHDAVNYGLDVSTISVVNKEIIKAGPKTILDYLTEQGVAECSFLPFMLNEQNKKDSYERFAPRMNVYSDFMIELSEYHQELLQKGIQAPAIGQYEYIKSRLLLPKRANIAAQTLFLLPNGDFVLPDYKDGYLEFLQPFGNIFKDEFDAILNSPERRRYLRRQLLRNNNSECISCPHQDICIMEFWKENRANDECFGASRYARWVVEHLQNEPIYRNKKLIF